MSMTKSQSISASGEAVNLKNEDVPKLHWKQLRLLWPYIRSSWKLGMVGAIGTILVSVLLLSQPYLIKIGIDNAIGPGDYGLLRLVILGLFGSQVLLFGASWAINYTLNKFSLEIITRIKRDIFCRLLRLPMSFFDEHQTGYLMARVGEVEGLNLFFSSTLVYVVVSFARSGLSLGILIHLNAGLTVVTLLALPLFFGITRLFTKDIRRLSCDFYEKSALLSRGMQDSLSGIEVVKSFGAEDREAMKFNLRLNDLRDLNVRKTIRMSLYSETLSFLGAGTGFVILWLSGWKIISGQFTLGSYIAFSAYFSQLLGPTQMLANLGLTLQPAKIALDRTREFLTMDAEGESGPIEQISFIKGNIDLRDVDFGYESSKAVFSKANLKVRAGEKILIAGPNGSGKSTLIKLIMGFYRPQGGDILIDGRPLQDISPTALRERISIVSQNTFLFSDTIRNNILYSSPEAKSGEVDEAIRLSGAMEFIRGLPKGLDTEIGERGIRLSGGEKQKLSIARAILRQSDLIIFDEATTHLDESSVIFLREMIQNRFVDKTCLVVSHRPIEIPVIDRIYWVEGGSIREKETRGVVPI
jgi:ABC-type multidrug transport system fused ATPase/permease subunit